MANTATDVRVAPLAPSHRPALSQALRECRVFNEAEISCCEELFDLSQTPHGHREYQFYGSFEGDVPVGFLGIGEDTLADRVMELYWILVSPSRHRRGHASALMKHFDDECRLRRARLATIWTSSVPGYSPAHSLYVRHGFSLVGRIQDYYKRGDDLLIFRKDYAS
jgi:GNAT superfamily N-acetyltransferase